MSTTADIVPLLREWGRLTSAEENAIEAEDWAAVATHQGQKSLLRAEIDEWQSARQRGPSDEATELVAALIEQEHRNRKRLEEKMLENRRASQETRGTSRNLLGVRKAYGGFTGCRWQSYS